MRPGCNRIPLERSRYWLTLISIPELHGRRVIRAAEKKLPGLYPGNIGETVWDYRLLKSVKKAGRDYLLVAVMAWDRSLEVPGNLYLPLFHGIDRKMPRRGQSLVISEVGTTDILTRSESGDYTLISRQGADASSMLGELRQRGGYRGAFRTNRSLRGMGLRLLALLLLIVTAAGLGLLDLGSRRAELANLEYQRRSIARQTETRAALRAAANLTRTRAPLPALEFRPLSLLLQLSAGLPGGTELHYLHVAKVELSGESESTASHAARLEVLIELIGPSALESIGSLAEGLAESGLELRLIDDVRPLDDGSRKERYRIEPRQENNR